MTTRPVNYLTIDVEDYFQVAAFEKVIHPSTWENYPSRVVQNTTTDSRFIGYLWSQRHLFYRWLDG